MKRLCCMVACLALAVALGMHSSSAQEEKQTGAPRFEDYAVEISRQQVATLDLRRSHPLARKYRTTFREQLLQEGINFAGRYALVSAGCGTGCALGAIIDTRTGRAYFPAELNGWTSIVGDYERDESEDLWTFRPHSRLLRGLGRPNIGRPGEERHGASGVYYYEWTNNRLRLVKFTHVGSYPKADPPRRSRRR